MKKFLLSALALGGIISLNAQSWVADSAVIGANYVNRTFYSLENGTVESVPFNTVDWLIDVSNPYSASIRINGGFNAALYKFTGGDTTAWGTYANDTTGMGTGTHGWLQVRDNEEDFFPSAFEAGASGSFNYGWGDYNQTTHNVIGNKLFVYKTVGGQYKKVWIKRLAATNSTYTILTADLNGANEQTVSISKQGATGKSFIYYSFASGQTTNVEPALNTYDLTFSKVVGLYGIVPNQAVTGVEINHGVLTAKAQGIPADDAVSSNYTLDDKLNGIGNNWKALNASFQWYALDSLSYFVQDLPGNIWQIRFTGFVGASAGKYKFQKRKVAYASVEQNETVGAWTVFPNPTSDMVSVVFSTTVADQAQFSVSDLNGRTVVTENFAANAGLNQFSVDLGSRNLPAGIYVATLRAGRVLKTTKLIIQ